MAELLRADVIGGAADHECWREDLIRLLLKERYSTTRQVIKCRDHEICWNCPENGFQLVEAGKLFHEVVPVSPPCMYHVCVKIKYCVKATVLSPL